MPSPVRLRMEEGARRADEGPLISITELAACPHPAVGHLLPFACANGKRLRDYQ